MHAIPATAAAAITCIAFASAAAGMAKDEYEASKARVAAQYVADRQKCGAHLGHAAELCVTRARGARNVAGAELEAAYKPGTRTHYAAAKARADADYALARKECENEKGAARRGCEQEATVARERAMAAAKAVR